MNSKEYISLKEHFDKILEERRRTFEVYIEQQQKAVDAAYRSMELRIDKLNELRDIATDKSELLPRAEYYANHRGIEEKIDGHSKLLYMGLGIMLVLEIVFRFLLKG